MNTSLQDVQSESMQLLIEAVQSISTCNTIPEIMEIVKATARRGTQADGATFVLKDGDQCYYADEDAISPLWKGRRFPMSQCVSGWAMLNRRAAVIPDITVDDRIPQDAYRRTFVRSLVMMPIRSRDPLGAIGIYWAQPHHASDATVSWLQALADATSAGIESVRAQEEIQKMKGGASRPPGEKELVRMCAWTRRLWHNGEWVSVEAFLHDRFGVDITHSISQDALDGLSSGLTREAAKPATSHIA